MVRRAWVETRSFTQRFSLGTQKRRSCRFGSQQRRVLLLACDTLLPDCERLPVTWQTLAIVPSSICVNGTALGQDGFGPLRVVRQTKNEANSAERNAAGMRRAGY